MSLFPLSLNNFFPKSLYSLIIIRFEVWNFVTVLSLKGVLKDGGRKKYLNCNWSWLLSEWDLLDVPEQLWLFGILGLDFMLGAIKCIFHV